MRFVYEKYLIEAILNISASSAEESWFERAIFTFSPFYTVQERCASS